MTGIRAGRLVRAAVAALAVASMGVTGLALLARFWWIADLLTHFRLQLLAAQLALLAALLMTRQRRLGAVLGACGVLNWLYLYPVVWPIGGPVTAAPPNLSLMTVNVDARNDDAASLRAVIERENPDLVLIVEFTERWDRHLAPLYAEYRYRKLAPEPGAFGLALLSRYPFAAASAVRLESTVAIDASVDGPNGAFRLLGVHLRPPVSRRWSAERNRQLTRLAEKRAAITDPLIVLGDLNISPYSPHFSDWLATTGLTDTLAHRGPSATWPSFMPVLGIPIDHCLVSDHFTVAERRHLPEFGSDHYPVLVRLVQGRTP